MKKLLTQRIKKTEEIPKYLSIKQAKLYLEKKEFLVNESKLYKMTSESKILFYQSGNRNYFFPDEQEEWLQEQLGMKSETSRYLTGRPSIVWWICCSSSLADNSSMTMRIFSSRSERVCPTFCTRFSYPTGSM